MLKKLLILAGTLIFSLSVQAAKFSEGDYYKVLSTPKSETSQVTEYFSLFCPHCKSFEPIIAELKKTLPENTKFNKNHVSFMGGALAPMISKAYATSVVLDVDAKMIPVLFRRIQDLRQPPRNDDEVRQLFLDNGVTADEFDGAYNSFMVSSIVKRSDKSFEDAGLTGVPAVVVNNKYLVVTDNIKSTAQYFDLVNYLLTL